MDRFKYGWMLVAVLWLCTPAQAQEFTMEQAVEHALKGNPSVESKLLTLEQAKMNIGVAQSYFWPRVSLVSSNNRLENSGAAGSTDRSVQPLLVARRPGEPVPVRGLRALKQSGQVAAFRGHGGSQTPAGQAGADRQRAASVPPVAQGPRRLEKR